MTRVAKIYDPIPDTSSVIPWDPKGIAHFQVIIDRTISNRLEFSTKEISNYVAAKYIEQYAKVIASKNLTTEQKKIEVEKLEKLSIEQRLVDGTPRYFTSRVNSPYNMPILSQCYVLIELDPSIENWQFEVGQCSVTCKHLKDGWDFGLFDVYPNETREPDGWVGGAEIPVKYDDCRVVYFGVAKRGPTPDSKSFNLHTEYLQGGLATKKRLQVTFDPDVPNEGGPGFP